MEFQIENKELKKYLYNDTIFNIINSEFISLEDGEMKDTNKYLLAVIEALLARMRLQDTLFCKTYKHITFCGSYYKNTKVGQPNEFDLNIVFDLPIDYITIDFSSTRPAFVQLNVIDSHVYNLPKHNGLTEQEKRVFSTLISNGFLDPNKFRSWFEGILYKVYNKLPMFGNKHILNVSCNKLCFHAALNIKKSGPAFTLMINILKKNKNIDVDLVPTLKFDCRNRKCFAIPVPVCDKDGGLARDQHWRLSFCLQENEILKKYGRVKPIIRQMKKLRDTQNWKSIASYYIETLFYNKLTELEPNLNKIPATFFFFIMLMELYKACAEHEIRYFWNKDYNLLEKIGKIEMQNISYRLKCIIKNIERKIITNELILATYILNSEEFSLLKRIYKGQEDVECEEEEQPSQWQCILL
ncbi:cGAS-like receptor 1 [Xylocopa sonorina]|uniref:cGAS-like receptor 1 n=1 Tax=Xylocopa sonorina TaxID=1818115 RepID=UPI00403ADB1F